MAAPPAEYMIEGISAQQTPVVNAHMKKRVSEGWTLHTFGSSYLVWQKYTTSNRHQLHASTVKACDTYVTASAYADST